MAYVNQLIFSFSAFLVITLLAGNVFSVAGHDIDQKCLGCLCEASSNCNVSTACHVPHAEEYFCGPFLISYAYWTDAGKVVLAGDNPDRKGAFESCTLDLQCAAEVIRNYMIKFGQDCNGDGIVDCEDFVRLHYMGGYDCNTKSFAKSLFYTRYSNCFNVIDAATTNPKKNFSFLSNENRKLH